MFQRRLRAGRLGVPTTLLTALAADARGRRLAAHLVEFGGSIHAGGSHLQHTPTATAAVGADGSASYRFDIEWPALAPVEGRPRALHAGSIALFMRPGADHVMDLLPTAHESILVTVDPNIRPALVGDPALARRRAVASMRQAHIVKLSAEDAHFLYPGESRGAVLDQVLDLGPRVVALTDGSRGSVLSTQSTRVVVPARQTHVVDTVGAGDAYMAGMLYGILDRDGGDDPTHLATLTSDDLFALGATATAVATLVVQRVGARPPSLSDLRADAAATRPRSSS